MADILNIPPSGAAGTGNTGVDVSDLKAETIKGLFLTDANFVLDEDDRADADTVIAAIQTAITADRGGRIYPIHDLVNMDDQSSDPTQGPLGNLTPAQIDLADGIPAFLFGHYNGEVFHKKLARFNNQSLRIFFYDQNFTLFGTKDSSGNLKGYTLSQFQSRMRKFGTSSDSAKYPFRVVLQSESEFKDNSAFVALDSRIAAINGIIDVVLTKFSLSSNVLKVQLLTESGTNVAELFSTELASSSAWSVKKRSDGSSFTVTSYAYDSTNKVITITYDSTVFTALASGAIIDNNLVSAQALAALDITPYESMGKLPVTKP